MANRDENGKFIKGNKASPGRKPKPIEEKYLQILIRSVPQNKWRAIIAKVVVLAERGERWAVEFLADRIIGKPVQPVNAEHSGDVTFVVQYADGISDNPTETP